MIELGLSGVLKQRHLKLIFRAAAFLALIYTILAIAKQWKEISEWRPDTLTVFVLVVLIGTYRSSLFLLAEMWHRLILIVSGKILSRSLTLPSYTQTQVAKYLPGNVFHLISRHAYLSSHGFEHRQLVRALALEVVFLIFGAVIVAVIGFLLFGSAIGGKSMPVPVIFGFSLFILVAVFTFTKMLSSEQTPYGTAIIAAALSWIAGYVVPGAPGGLGIREFVQLTLGNLGLSAPEALIAIALFRRVTILEDAMCFIIGQKILK